MAKLDKLIKLSESKLTLYWAITTFIIGLLFILSEPVLKLYKIEYEGLEIYKQNYSIGWSFIICSLVIQAIDKIPEIIESIARVWKGRK